MTLKAWRHSCRQNRSFKPDPSWNDAVASGSAPAPGAVRRASRRTLRGVGDQTKVFIPPDRTTGGRGVRQHTRGRLCSPFPIAWFRLRNLVSLAALAMLAAGCVVLEPNAELHPKPGPGIFFVALNGNDAWSGKLPAPNANASDGPFASVPGALAAARQWRALPENAPRQTVRLIIRGGTYYLPEPIVLKPEDSHLIIETYPHEHPYFSGGRRIVGWKEVSVGGRKLWTTEVPEAREGKWLFRELWVNNRRAVRARNPNRGYLKVAAVPDAKPEQEWHQGQSRFAANEGDLPTLAHAEDAEVIVMTRWVESRLPVAKVDAAERMFYFAKRSTYKVDPNDLWYAEGAQEFLDAAGEWFLDRREGRLYYAPLPDETLIGIEAIAPVLQHLVLLEGQPESGRYVENVTLRGITLSHSEWKMPSDARTAEAAAMTWPAPVNEIGGFGQAAVGVPGAVRGDGVRNSHFDECAFVHLGSYGLELGRGCQSNLVTRCEFADLAGGGIKIGETRIRDNPAEQTHHNEISDCTLLEGGRMYHSAVGIWIGQSGTNRIAHNIIRDFYYTGISIGWTWGYGPTLSAGNQVEFNHVHHIGVMSDGDGPILSDMGGIYMLGMQPGTRVINNLWHDIAGFRYGGWGIYTDEGSSGILVESNLVYRTTHGGFHQHYGATNIVRNNIFAFARDQQLQRSRDEDHVSFSFSNNIVLFDKGVLLGSTWKNDKFVLDRNLYWDLREPDAAKMKFPDGALEQWRQRGHDHDSIIADPLFAAPDKDDYQLRRGSPALKLGFKPIQLREIGPRRPKSHVP